MPPRDVKTSVNTVADRSESAARGTLSAALVQECRVVTVSPTLYTVDVRTQNPPYRTELDIQFSSPYGHFVQGEGIHYMPEIGATCWVCWPSDGQKAFVLGWSMPEEVGTYRGGREFLNPGDIYLATRDRNFVHLRRGGVVQIGATSVCQTVYLPTRNILQHFAENYEIHTPAGDLAWQVLRSDEDKEGKQRCQLVLGAHEYADDPAKDPEKDPVALLKIGSHGEKDKTILTLLTRDKGGGTIQTDLKIDKEGTVRWTVHKDYTLDVKGSYQIDAGKKITMNAAQDMTLTTRQAFKAEGLSVSVKSKTTAEVKASGTASVDGAKVNLGTADGPVLIALSGPTGLPAFFQLLAATVNQIGGQITALGGVAPAPVVPPQGFLSKKVSA